MTTDSLLIMVSALAVFSAIFAYFVTIKKDEKHN